MVFVGISLRSDFKKIKYRTLKLIALIIYFSIVRLIFFGIGFPSKLLTGALIDPAYFASTFAGGLVKSPLEFLVTNIFLVVIGYYFAHFSIDYFLRSENKKLKLVAVIVSPLIAILSFYTLRGLSASIKSVIFDSSIRYFKEPSLIPNLPSLVMNINILMIGFACLAVMLAMLIIVGKFLNLIRKENSKYRFILLFLIIQIACYIFFDLLKEPLLTHLLVIVFITLLFFLIYISIYKHLQKALNVIFIAVISSIISITMLNYFNLELEKRSLKKIAYEVDRADDELLKFVIDETLINSVKNTRTLNLYSKRTVNFNAEAFIIWSNSSLQRESLNSLVVLYDRNQKVLGRFSVGFNQEIDFFDYIKNIDVNHPTLQKIDYPHGSFSNYYVGIIPVIKNEIIQGYIAVATAYNLESLSADRFPEFLESNKAALGSVMELELINIFKFEEGNVTQVYGDIFPSREQRQQIFNTKLSEFNDGWLTVSINSEKYLTFVLKRLENEKELITSVSIKEKEITWDLFNFFKIFIVHTIFNFLLFVILVLLGLIHVQYSFRTRLLFAFLLISIIPTVALAVYNRQIVEERTESSIFNELSKRSNYLENHVRAQKQKHKDREIIKAFDNAGKELGISFAVFGISDQLYNSRKEFYDADLFNRKLNSQAHFTLNYLSYREFLTQESINNFDYSAYYRKISIEENSYIIGVNDAFNKIKLTYSTVDVDILLFGIYSFALIFIAMLSTIFANQISAPIRRLTKATEAVAQGDLNVYLENKEKGEIKGLFDGFNSMTKELQKNQYEIAQLERENAWKEMAKQVAHEIKNPLTPMKLSMQQLIASFSD
ncbi:MAG: HAMP domain-containing protein, partial [Promethearchaeota archaeon]